MSDSINSPPHYNSGKAECCGCEKKIECIDVTRHMSFNLGNAIKYIWRCELKGNKREDLEKAIWYLKDELKFNDRKIEDILTKPFNQPDPKWLKQKE